MRHTLRLLLLLEGASFVLAGLVHFGVLARGHEHGSAATAESIIGAVLLVALALTCGLPAWTRPVGIVAPGFALLGTLVGALRSLSASDRGRCPMSPTTLRSCSRWPGA